VFAADRTMSVAELRNRIKGGWAGQMIGVTIGAPTEFRSLGKVIQGDLPAWSPEKVADALDQDDLYVDMTLAKVLDIKGLSATTEDFGAMFKEAQYPLWHANLAARRNLRRGVPAALAGSPRYNAHANDIDFQIESDFIGLMSPGLYRASNDIAVRAGRVMNSGDGLYGGLFISCMYAAAFFEKDVRLIVETGVRCIPPQSPYAQLVQDVLAWHKQYPSDWQKTWQLIYDKWDKNDPCPEGALLPFNIDAKLNGAYVALGVLYGGGDFAKTIDVATRAGQDSDCNPSSAAGIVGVILGYDGIPEYYRRGIPAMADRKFAYTDFTFDSIVASTEARALSLIKANGGSVSGDHVKVKVQTPSAPKFESWTDVPVERIVASDPRWNWTGEWRSRKPRRNAEETSRQSESKGAEGRITFEGTGAIVQGPLLENCGRADVYLDGKLDRTVDACSDENASKLSEAIWHTFGLPAGKHEVRIMIQGERYASSTNAIVVIDSLIVYRAVR
jgi:hypothetical protein